MQQLYKTIIIDDEEPARIGLLNLLKQFPEVFDIVDIAKNGIEAKEKIEALKPDIVFLDIEMPECSGFQLLKQLKIIPIVIFCTAYHQYALEAFETNSIDYIVKPVKLERIQKTVNKLKTFEKKVSSEQILKVLKEIGDRKEQNKMTSITVKKEDRLIFIKLESVSFFEANNNYVQIHSESGIHLTTESISSLQDKLPDCFLRVHRGVIINKEYVKDIQKYFNSRYVITFNDIKKTSITTGRSYGIAIKSWIDL